MREKSQNEFISKFISEVKSKYPDLVIGYDYNEEDEIFDIWHNSKTLQFEDKEFLKTVGVLIKDILYNNGIFNISFSYDYSKENIKEKSYVIQENMLIDALPKIVLSCSQAVNNYSVNTNTVFNTNLFSNIIASTKIEYIPQGKNYVFDNKIVEKKELLVNEQWSLFEQLEVVGEGLAA